MFDLVSLLPMAAAAPSKGLMDMMIPMAAIFGIMYFMLIRPQQRKEKERKALIENLKSGTRVLFCGGIIGTITNVKDATFIIKVADNVKIEVARGAVTRVIEKGEKLSIEDEK